VASREYVVSFLLSLVLDYLIPYLREDVMPADEKPLVGAPQEMARLYALFDTVSRCIHGTLLLERLDGPAVRVFHQVLGNPQTLPGTHPADFNLIHVGCIWTDGTIEPQAPVVVATGAGWYEQFKREEARLAAQS
jgi:hypothetical protein